MKKTINALKYLISEEVKFIKEEGDRVTNDILCSIKASKRKRKLSKIK